MKFISKIFLSFLAVILTANISASAYATTEDEVIGISIGEPTTAPIEDAYTPQSVDKDEEFSITVGGYLPNSMYTLLDIDVDYMTAHQTGNNNEHRNIIRVKPLMILNTTNNNLVATDMIIPYKKEVKIKGQQENFEIVIEGSNQTITKKIEITDNRIIPEPLPPVIQPTITLRGLFKKSTDDEYKYELTNINGNRLVLLKESESSDIDYDDFLDKGVVIKGRKLDVDYDDMTTTTSDDIAIRYNGNIMNENDVAIKYNGNEINVSEGKSQNVCALISNSKSGVIACEGTVKQSAKILEIVSIEIIQTGNTFENSPEDEVEAEIIPFIDVDRDYWAKDYIGYLKDNSIVSGFSDGTFKPENHISKSEVAKIITGITGNKYDDKTVPERLLSKNASDWQKKVAILSKDLDIIEDDEAFLDSVNEESTRGEIVRMILKAADIGIDDIEEKTFADIDLNDPNWKYIEKAKQLGIVSGYEDGTFKPDTPVQRDQMAKIIKNTIEML